MREILFRAKKNFGNIGEWVIGLVAQPHTTEDGIVTSYYFTELKENGISSHTTVSANTVGQYTGLTDKNGKKIFEGDIVKTKTGRLCEVYWFNSPKLSGWDLNPLEFEHNAPSGYDLFLSENLEVIGNIHDNPELLEGGAE